jgi:aspartate racemase
MHIGLIGGIGPAATVHYYRALVRAFDRADKKMSLTIVHADSREMVGNMTAGQREAQAEIFVRFADQLRAGGCEAVALTSMGGHFCIAQFEPRSPLPVLNAIPVLNRTFAEKGLKRVGILGTRAVMESGLYGVSSTQVVAPPPEEIKRTHDTYLAIADAGVATEAQRSYLEHIASRLQRDHGAEAIVLGGTDLFVAFDRKHYDYEIIDCAIVHAEAIASVAVGHSGDAG